MGQDLDNGMSGANDSRTGTDARTYDATRTAATNNGETTTMWTWVIVIVAAVAIFGLIGYYGMSNGDSKRDNY
jgi:hypothetical protein